MKRFIPIRQRGFLLIEALIAILIFSLGILGMIAMGGTAIGAQSDANYRTDATRLTEDIANTIALNVDRTDAVLLSASLAPFQHQATGVGCAFSGTASTDPMVTAWLSKVTTPGVGLPGLPGTIAAGQQIIVTNSAGSYNRVEITVCWKDPGTPAGTAMRRHTLVTYVN